MKTISVRDAAAALGITNRAVLYRREKGQLKGQLIKNDHGVPEYRIYPNKEIIEGLRNIGSPLIASEAFQEADIVEAEAQTVFEPADDIQDMGVADSESDDGSAKTHPGDWTGQTRATAGGVAEELWSNLISRFLEKLEGKDQLIGEMRVELADKDRQLKLLPDFEKQAEDERKAAELKELEAESLRKQIAALQAEQEESERAQAESQRIAHEEIDRLKEEKEAQSRAVQQQLEALSLKVDDLQRPWWKKWFAAGGDPTVS